MRSVVKKKNENRFKQFLLGTILILVMFVSVVGYGFQNNSSENSETEKELNYNGFDFYKQGNFWITNFGDEENPVLLIFKYNPKETESTKNELNRIEDYYYKPLYIFTENYEASAEIERNLFTQTKIVKRVQPACIADENCEGEWAVKNCSDNLIIIKKSEAKNIIQKENCVYIEGPSENLTSLADEFLFDIFQIK